MSRKLLLADGETSRTACARVLVRTGVDEKTGELLTAAALMERVGWCTDLVAGRTGTLLATWENYSPEPPAVYFPIFKSKNGGKTWKHISNVTDQVNGWGLRYQPFLYQLPQRVGKYPKGTILLSGSSIPTDLSATLIEVYASRDQGYTWEFVSHVALGGEALPNHGLTPVWEPFLM